MSGPGGRPDGRPAAGGRRWLEVRVEAVGKVEPDLVPTTLVEHGARGVVEEGGRFVAYFEEPADPASFLDALAAALESGFGVAIEHRWQDHEDWAETWKRGLGPRRVGDRLVVHPSWKPPDTVGPDDVVIVLDPGMAFGTAEHGTTRGCLRVLERAVGVGDRVVDVGAGSGILSIAAALLGASEVRAVEGDPLACEAMRENVERNRVADRVTIENAWVSAAELRSMGMYDVVVANIETGLMIPLLEGMADAVGPGGRLLLSGVLDREWSRVEDAVAALGFAPHRVDADGEWRAGLFRRTP